MSLPQTRLFLTSLLSSLPPSPSPSANPLKQASAGQKSTLLALHVLFPNELLPALDLLDRDLVTRLGVRATAAAGQSNAEAEAEAKAEAGVFYVRSARRRNQRYGDAASVTTHYEVRLDAWSCSCPAFVFSAFPAVPSDPDPASASASASASRAGARRSLDREDVEPAEIAAEEEMGREGKEEEEEEEEEEDEEGKEKEAEAEGEGEGEANEWSVGGLSLGTDVPICKHLLACVLGEYGGCFGGYVRKQEVSAEELAGWAAGWGD